MKTHIIPFFLLTFFSLLFIVPVLLLLVQACIPPEEAALVAQGASPLRLWPYPLSLDQFSILFSTHEEFLDRFFHDLIWCAAVSLIQVFLSVIDGYILAKYQNKFISILTIVFTLTLLIPMQIFLIPTYRMAQRIGIGNHVFLLYLPLACTPLGTLLMRQIYLRLPDERIEYLRLEGGGFPQLLLDVLLPYGRLPALVLFFLTFADGWGMIEQPLILLTNKAAYPLSMLLYDMRRSQPQLIYAASMLTLIPIFSILLLTALRRSGFKPD